MATNFTNRSFTHFFITIGNVLPNYINSTKATYEIFNTNLFAYVAINRYLSNKFYEIMIDISAFKHFIAGY